MLPGETDSDALRFRILETLREYAQERLAERKEADAVRGRHLSYFLALAEEADERLQGAEQLAWLDRLETEHDNLRAALNFGLRTGYLAEGGGGECGLRESGQSETP